MKNIRLWLPVMALAGLISAGCFLVTGQFTVTFNFNDPATPARLRDTVDVILGFPEYQKQ